MQTTPTSTDINHRTNSSKSQKSWGSLSYYPSSPRPTRGMVADPSKVVAIDAASTCIICCIVV